MGSKSDQAQSRGRLEPPLIKALAAISGRELASTTSPERGGLRCQEDAREIARRSRTRCGDTIIKDRDPGCAITRVRYPVLAFFGSKDDIGGEKDLARLTSSGRRLAHGPARVDTAMIANGDHEYVGEEAQAAQVITRWVQTEVESLSCCSRPDDRRLEPRRKRTPTTNTIRTPSYENLIANGQDSFASRKQEFRERGCMTALASATKFEAKAARTEA